MAILNPTKTKIGDLLGGMGARVEIPSYQRSFSWSTDEANDLYTDLKGFLKKHPGEMIYQGAEYFLGAIVGVKREDTALVLLDGQQRLATLTILLSSIRDQLQELEPSMASQLQTTLIQEQPMPGKAIFTNRLTLSEYDKDFFRDFVQKFPRDHSAKPKRASHKLIQKVRVYFDKELTKDIQKKTKHEKSEFLYRLWTVILTCLIVVVVECTDEDDANEVFEVLNERGVGLSTIDLVRNFVLGAAAPQDREAIVSAWGEIFSVSDNATKVQAFIRHFWISRHGDVKARRLYREIKQKLDIDFSRGRLTPYQFSAQLAAAANDYRELIEPSTDSDELNGILTTISKLEATPLYPLLLSTYQQHPGSTAKMAEALLSHYVRWTIIGRKESTALEALVFRLAQEVSGGLAIQGAIAQIRDSSLTDEEFRKEFETASITKAGQRRPILVALENHMRELKNENEVEPRSALVLHVEHLYSQSPIKGTKWDDHDDWVHRIGNLTLLSAKWNTAQKNGDFKKVKLKNISQSVLLLNEWIKGQSKWGPEQIAERQIKLAELAPHVWTFPD